MQQKKFTGLEGCVCVCVCVCVINKGEHHSREMPRRAEKCTGELSGLRDKGSSWKGEREKRGESWS